MMADKDITDLLVGIAKVGEKVDALHRRQDEHEQSTLNMLNRHNEAIYGNGRPGITSTLQSVEEKVKILADNEASKKRLLIRVVTPVFGVILLAFLYTTFGGSAGGY